jgi:catechol 2,3-dioxygenase-like lactoylglutathione lyase family enzyme
MKLQRTILFVKDLPRMADFYANTLGLPSIPETRADDWAEFDAGGAIFALHAIPAHVAKEIEIASPPQARTESAVKFCFSVDDIPAERARLEELGVTFLESPWGYCEAMDPEGNIFQLCTRTKLP